MTPTFIGNRQAAALTVAGSDSGGNAGIQADIRAFHAFGLHACTAITALTAQNPSGVAAVDIAPAPFVVKQLESVLSAYSLGAAKTGMLATEENVLAVAGVFTASRDIPLVVDPVMVATSGAKLLDDDAVEAVSRALLPCAALVTPNLPEAEVLSGLGRIASTDDMVAAARTICDKAGCHVLIKGGHRLGAESEDLLWTHDCGAWWFLTPVVESPASTHGTGCSLSAAIAAALALGKDIQHAVAAGKAYVYGAIRGSVPVGPNAAVLGFSNPEENASAVAVRRA